MKKIGLISLLCGTLIGAPVWEFTHFKDHEALMREDFFRTLHQLFKISIFVETGTGGGLTTERSAHVFEEVHSIEIQPETFLRAKDRLDQYPHVHLYNDDSAQGLKKVLASVDATKKSLFFLDAHYNGVVNGKGETNTPIMDELHAIFSSALVDPIIIIDDARMYRSPMEQQYEFSVDHCDQVFDYPHLRQIIAYVHSQKPNYKVYVYGDLIICYGEDIEVSPLIKFMTDDMLHNSTIIYDVTKAAQQLKCPISTHEQEAIHFLFNSKIVRGPVTYGKFFEAWHLILLLHRRLKWI